MIISSDYDITYETNHSDTSNFAQDEEDEEGHRKPFNTAMYQPQALTLSTRTPPEVNMHLFMVMFKQRDVLKV